MSRLPETGPRPADLPIGLAHIGVIVHRVEAACPLYASLGLPETRRMTFPQENIRIAFIPVEGARIELMEPIEPTGPLHRFLASRGEAIHHLAFEVSNLEAAMARVREAGGRLIDETPRQGSEGTKLAFIHPSSAHGVLIELVERPGGQRGIG